MSLPTHRVGAGADGHGGQRRLGGLRHRERAARGTRGVRGPVPLLLLAVGGAVQLAQALDGLGQRALHLVEHGDALHLVTHCLLRGLHGRRRDAVRGLVGHGGGRRLVLQLPHLAAQVLQQRVLAGGARGLALVLGGGRGGTGFAGGGAGLRLWCPGGNRRGCLRRGQVGLGGLQQLPGGRQASLGVHRQLRHLLRLSLQGLPLPQGLVPAPPGAQEGLFERRQLWAVLHVALLQVLAALGQEGRDSGVL